MKIQEHLFFDDFISSPPNQDPIEDLFNRLEECYVNTMTLKQEYALAQMIDKTTMTIQLTGGAPPCTGLHTNCSSGNHIPALQEQHNPHQSQHVYSDSTGKDTNCRYGGATFSIDGKYIPSVDCEEQANYFSVLDDDNDGVILVTSNISKGYDDTTSWPDGISENPMENVSMPMTPPQT